MRILLVGGGGREHAMAWKLSQSPLVEELYVHPGNPGMWQLPRTQPVPKLSSPSWKTLAQWSKTKSIDLLVVGPEQPLAEGISDIFGDVGIPAFGPSQKAALLEASKIFCKNVLNEANIPTAKAAACSNYEEALAQLKEFDIPLVIKADGLAAGKGVVICTSAQQAQDTLKEMFLEKKFGSASSRVLLEEFLEGPEVSFMVVASGTNYVPLTTAQDHKRLLDNDLGPNTGGMGAYSPTQLVSPELHREILTTIIEPTLEYLNAKGLPFTGVLYAGLMLTTKGPKVLEYNVRMGDPETQIILRRLQSDFAQLCWDAARGKELPKELAWSSDVSLGVVLAAAGYPEQPRKNDIIQGLEKLKEPIIVFHAGTKQEDGAVLSNGGRVLTVTSTAPTFEKAYQLAYAAINGIHFSGMQYRKDIAAQVIRDKA